MVTVRNPCSECSPGEPMLGPHVQRCPDCARAHDRPQPVDKPCGQSDVSAGGIRQTTPEMDICSDWFFRNTITVLGEQCPVIFPDGRQCTRHALTPWIDHDHPSGSTYPKTPDLVPPAHDHPFTD